MGSGTYVFVKYAALAGLDPTKAVYAEGFSTERIFETIVGLCRNKTLVMGIGNIGGGGLELVAYFQNRTLLPEMSAPEEEQFALPASARVGGH